MPDLGTYATEIALAYGASLTALAVLILWVWLRARRVYQTLATLEIRLNRKPHG